MFNRLLNAVFPRAAPAPRMTDAQPRLAAEAVGAFEAAIAADEIDAAAEIFKRVLADGLAGLAEQIHMRAQLLAEQGDFAGAVEEAQRALDMRPGEIKYMRTLAEALSYGPDAGRSSAGTSALLAAVPDDLALLFSSARLARRLACYAEAEVLYRRALALAPEHRQMHLGLAGSLFQQGNYSAEAWTHYVQQLGVNPWLGGPHAPQEAWQDQPQVKALRVWHSGGYGDFFHFCRFMSQLQARLPGTRIQLEVRPALVAIAARIPGVATVLPLGCSPLAAGELHTSLMALPCTLGAFDAGRFWDGPYIDAVRAPAAAARPRRIGIVWRSGRMNSASAITRASYEVRDVALARLLDALPKSIDTIVPLQQDEHALREIGELPAAARARLWPPAQCPTFDDTLQAIRGLDLVISVDTSVAHLAAAMGHPLAVLCHFDVFFAWHGAWYPQAKVLRQRELDDWAGTLAELRNWLEEQERLPG